VLDNLQTKKSGVVFMKNFLILLIFSALCFGTSVAKASSMFITGDIEGHQFSFIVDNMKELNKSCTAFYGSKGFGSVDDINVQVNGGQTHRLHTSGWWTSSQQVCDQILKVAMKEVPNTSGLTVTGDIEGHSFTFFVDSVKELNKSCIAFYESKGFGSVDDINVQVNGGQTHRLHTSGWWTSSQQVCDQILKVAMKEVPNSSGLTVTGDIEGHSFTFFVDSVKELNKSCIAFYESKGFGSVDDINVQINGGQTHRLHTSGWWTSSQQVCDQILKVAVKEVPSTSGLTVTGDIEGHQFTFFVDNIKELNKSCIAFYDSKGFSNVDDINVQVNGGQTHRLHTSGWWTNSQQVCTQIVAVAAKEAK
jgi:O-phosphoseryl-tRNA(Cys) synthetase